MRDRGDSTAKALAAQVPTGGDAALGLEPADVAEVIGYIEQASAACTEECTNGRRHRARTADRSHGASWIRTCASSAR